MSNADVVRASYRAYQTADRELVESILADDLVFSAPPDVGIDRATYFERCWPGAGRIGEFDIQRLIEDGDEVVVTYLATREDGTQFRNTEIFSVRDGKIVTIEVYFGWDVP